MQSKSPRPRNYSFSSTCSEEQDEGSDTSSVHSDRSSSVMTTLVGFSLFVLSLYILSSFVVCLVKSTVFTTSNDIHHLPWGGLMLV